MWHNARKREEEATARRPINWEQVDSWYDALRVEVGAPRRREEEATRKRQKDVAPIRETKAARGQLAAPPPPRRYWLEEGGHLYWLEKGGRPRTEKEEAFKRAMAGCAPDCLRAAGLALIMMYICYVTKDGGRFLVATCFFHLFRVCVHDMQDVIRCVASREGLGGCHASHLFSSPQHSALPALTMQQPMDSTCAFT